LRLSAGTMLNVGLIGNSTATHSVRVVTPSISITRSGLCLP
jgi:hypothetical protein